MKKIVFFLILLVVIVFIYLIKIYSYNPLSLIVPPSKDIKQYLPLDNKVLSPISIPQNYQLLMYADLKSDLPRALAFDDRGTLFTSITKSGKVLALPDNNKDLKVDEIVQVANNLNRPHGITFNDGYLYVAESDKVSRYLYDAEKLSISNKQILFSLPNGGRHFTRTIRIFNNKLYTSVGSSCDVCIEQNPYRASILVSNLDGSELKIFAKGLRNTVFFDFDNQGRIWGMDMGRDNLGDQLPPEELNLIEEGKDYGWPYCYGNRIKDYKFNADSSKSCAQTEPPEFELDAHQAPLGVAFDAGENLLIALHGSWNSSVPVGYKIVKLNFFAGKANGFDNYIDGFKNENNEIIGRPVDLKFDDNNNLFISDDKTGLIYVLAKN